MISEEHQEQKIQCKVLPSTCLTIGSRTVIKNPRTVDHKWKRASRTEVYRLKKHAFMTHNQFFHLVPFIHAARKMTELHLEKLLGGQSPSSPWLMNGCGETPCTI